MSQGNATASGLVCRACTTATTPQATDLTDTVGRAVTSNKVLIVVAAAVLGTGVALFGWDFVWAFLERFMGGLSE